MTLQEKASQIVRWVGGTSNVASLSHCVTRLRFNLKDDAGADLPKLKGLDGIMGVQRQGGQTQVVIGGEVVKVYREIVKQFPSLGSGSGAEEPVKKKSLFNNILDVLSSILVASLAPIVGGGMLKGLVFLLTDQHLIDAASDTAFVMNIVADSMFYFFPFLLAVSAAKKFKTDEYMALTLAGALMYPSLSQAAADGRAIHFLGALPILAVNYQSSVVPIILSVFVLSYLYRYIEDRMPSMLNIIFTPLLTLLIMVPFMLFCVAPIGFYIGEYIAMGMNAIINFAPWLAGFVVGATRPVLVLAGMHHALRPLTAQQIATYNYSTLGAMNFMSTMAQATGALAAYLLCKNKKLRQISLSSTVSGYLGITEPALYGVIVKYRAVLIGVTLGGGIGGLVGSVMGARAYAPAMPSVVSIPVYLGTTASGFFAGLAATVVSTLLITVLLAKTVFKIDEGDFSDADTAMKTSSMKTSGAKAAAKRVSLFSPADGEALPIRSVSDETFAAEILGKSFAVRPADGNVYSPADGTVALVFDTKHAITVLTEDGAEVLLHIGINTVNLKGRHFEPVCEAGQKVKAGDLLLRFNKEEIEREGYDSSVIMVVTNTGDYASVASDQETGNIKHGDKALTVVTA